MPETDYGKQLVDVMSTLRPTPPRDPCRRDYFVEEKLKTCIHVFVRNDTARTSLDRVYTGPFRVLGREEKYFTLDLGGDRVDNVSINRLKACSLLLDLQDSNQGSFEEQPLLVGPEAVPATSPETETLAPKFLVPLAREPPRLEKVNRFVRLIRRPVRYRRSMSRQMFVCKNFVCKNLCVKSLYVKTFRLNIRYYLDSFLLRFAVLRLR